jgi:hypothetical protein
MNNYPQWLYHASESPRIAADPEEHATLGEQGYVTADEHFAPAQEPAKPKGKKAGKTE